MRGNYAPLLVQFEHMGPNWDPVETVDWGGFQFALKTQTILNTINPCPISRTPDGSWGLV